MSSKRPPTDAERIALGVARLAVWASALTVAAFLLAILTFGLEVPFHEAVTMLAVLAGLFVQIAVLVNVRKLRRTVEKISAARAK